VPAARTQAARRTLTSTSRSRPGATFTGALDRPGLRLSLGRWTTAADVEAAATAIAEAARRLVITSLEEHQDAGVAAG
jgi:hypothetical protein